MRAHILHVTHDFAKPADAVFAYLSQHENLGEFLNAKVTRLSDGDTDRNGVGSRRQLKVGPLPPFEETVTEYVPGRRLGYKITKGSPLKDHWGLMEFSDRPGGGCHLDYKIKLASPIPGVAGIVKKTLTKSITDTLPKVDAAA
jgi:uncharacterized protein YndB with AHSA1/START domain